MTTRILKVERDDNGVALPDLYQQIGSKTYTGVDTNGVALSFSYDVKGLVIIPTEAYSATPYYIVGNTALDHDPIEIVGAFPLPVAAEASTTIATVKAKTGTIDFGVIYGR